MIFDYFFYKLYNIILKSGIPEFPRFYASIAFGLLINLNLFMVDTILSKQDVLSSIYNNNTVCYISTPVIAAIVFFVYNNRKIKMIKIKFAKDEFKYKKKKLDVVFILYAAFSLLFNLILACYKPGYIP